MNGGTDTKNTKKIRKAYLFLHCQYDFCSSLTNSKQKIIFKVIRKFWKIIVDMSLI